MPIITGGAGFGSPRLSLTRNQSYALGPFGGSLYGSFSTSAPSSGSTWADVFNTGLGIFGSYLQSRQTQTPQAQPTMPMLSIGAGSLTMPTATPANAAAIIPALVAAGARIVGSVIRISRAAWALVPAVLKQAALAAGLTLLFTDDGDENGERKRRRGRGITAAQLKGFHRVNRIICSLGMTPRRAVAKRRCRK